MVKKKEPLTHEDQLLSYLDEVRAELNATRRKIDMIKFYMKNPPE
jgi:hypothetical protein